MFLLFFIFGIDAMFYHCLLPLFPERWLQKRDGGVLVYIHRKRIPHKLLALFICVGKRFFYIWEFLSFFFAPPLVGAYSFGGYLSWQSSINGVQKHFSFAFLAPNFFQYFNVVTEYVSIKHFRFHLLSPMCRLALHLQKANRWNLHNTNAVLPFQERVA